MNFVKFLLTSTLVATTISITLEGAKRGGEDPKEAKEPSKKARVVEPSNDEKDKSFELKSSMLAACLQANSDLLKHASNGNLEGVQNALEAKAYVNVQNNEGHTPLHLATVFGHSTTVQQLIAAGASVSLPDNEGYTPLHIAASWGRDNVTKQLIDAGASVITKNNDGDTPFDIAKRYNATRIMQLLSAHNGSSSSSKKEVK